MTGFDILIEEAVRLSKRANALVARNEYGSADVLNRACRVLLAAARLLHMRQTHSPVDYWWRIK